MPLQMQQTISNKIFKEKKEIWKCVYRDFDRFFPVHQHIHAHDYRDKTCNNTF